MVSFIPDAVHLAGVHKRDAHYSSRRASHATRGPQKVLVGPAQWETRPVALLEGVKKKNEALAWVNGMSRRAASIIPIRKGGTDHGGSTPPSRRSCRTPHDPD